MSNFPSSPTRNMTSHSKDSLAFHSLLRWKMILIQILTTLLMHFLFRRLGECTFWANNGWIMARLAFNITFGSLWIDSDGQRSWNGWGRSGHGDVGAKWDPRQVGLITCHQKKYKNNEWVEYDSVITKSDNRWLQTDIGRHKVLSPIEWLWATVA